MANDWPMEEIRKAYDFSVEFHKEQKRESGEPYINHPVWIAKIVAQLNLGPEAVIASLLHDCIEDTEATLDMVAKEFGDEVALLVEGLTDIRRNTKSIELHQTSIDVYRNFLFSSVNDVRVLIIRIVDKLHNGLTLDCLPDDRRRKYANRILGIYGPICEYVGLHFFKKVLEDIAFKVLYPEESAKLEEAIKVRSEAELRAQKTLVSEIERMLKTNKIGNYQIQTRIKSLYSTYIKMKHGVYDDKDKFKDRVGIRILTETVDECYMILGLLHARYSYIADEFNDYISSPKPNGYRSIQTTFKWKDRIMAELQIRTYEMHEFDEYGPASHIAYKMSQIKGKGMGLEWVKDLVKWQKGGNVNNYRIKVLSEYIYVFTPKGDVLQLPEGSTPIDFAYNIHTALGDHCRGVLINGKIGKIDSTLKTGDLVEIKVSKKILANPEWMRLVKTDYAKNNVRRLRNRIKNWGY